MGTGIAQTAQMRKPAPRLVSAGPPAPVAPAFVEQTFQGDALGTAGPGSVRPLPSGTLGSGAAGCFSPLEPGDLGHSELQGRLSNCLLIFLHEKASRPAFHPGCGWVTFASFSTGNYDGNYRGSVWLCVKPSRGRA